MRRPVFRRVPSPRAGDHALRRGERLSGQGPLRRHAGGLPAGGLHLEEGRHPDRQRGAVRRDGRIRFRGRHGRRALRRAQLRRQGGGGRRRRPWLRVHDRRPGGRAGSRGRQLRRGHVRRYRLGTGRAGRAAGQTEYRTCEAVRGIRFPGGRTEPAAGNAPEGHRLGKGPGDPGAVRRIPAEVQSGYFGRIHESDPEIRIQYSELYVVNDGLR